MLLFGLGGYFFVGLLDDTFGIKLPVKQLSNAGPSKRSSSAKRTASALDDDDDDDDIARVAIPGN